MNEALLVGVLALGVPLFGIGYFLLRGNRGIFGMFAAMLLIGLGYLTATGALTDIGHKILGAEGQLMPVSAPAPVPAAETPAPAADATEPAAAPEPDAVPAEDEPAPAEDMPAPEAPANEPAPAPAPAP